MATYDCTINGVRARVAASGVYWFGPSGGNLGTSTTDDEGWGVNDGEDFFGGNVNPMACDPSGNSKFTVAIKVTTPNLSNVTISALTITVQGFDHSYKGNTSTYPLYASLRTTSTSSSSDTYSTFRNYAIGNEASTSSLNGNELNLKTWSPTFYGSFSPNTSYYLFLYTKSTSQIYGFYHSGAICTDAYVTYTQNAASYTVSLSRGTGISSVSGSGTYTEGDLVTIRATPSSGYSFVNWTGSETSTANPYSFYIYGNKSYTANASSATYLVQYKAGTYGSGTDSSVYKTHGTNLTLKGAQFTRSGYTQTDWASDAAGTVWANILGGTYQTDAPATFYPYWTPNIYTLTINPNGGTMYNGDSTTSSLFTTEFSYGVLTYIGNLDSYEGYQQDNRPTKPGYTCTGFTFSGGSGQQNTSGATFYFMGETPAAAMVTASDTRSWVFNGNYAGNVTATAEWVGNTYNVVYNANGGTGSMASTSHTYGEGSSLRANSFTNSGYTFTGWNTKEDGTGTTYANNAVVTDLTPTAGGTVTLYAQWGEATYTVIFNLNGGTVQSGDFSNMTCARNTNYTIPTGTIVANGLIFLGWSTSSSATTATYTAGSTFNNLEAAGATAILYAVWDVKEFTIKYHDNNNGNTISVNCIPAATTNTFRTLPSGWTKDGYEAIGWSKSASATSPDYRFGQGFVDDLGVADGATLNLYVVWTPQQPWTQTQLYMYIDSRDSFVLF